MSNTGNERNQLIYKELIGKFGNDVKSLNWGSKESQELRFKVLCEIDNLEKASVLDIGSGLGDLYEWMRKKYSSFEYSGIDITQEMVDASIMRFPGIKFQSKDVLESDFIEMFDYVLMSGVFTYQNEEFLKLMISKVFNNCKSGMAFNALSAWGSDLDQEEYYADPGEILTFCKTLTNSVVLRHNYHPRDFTVYLYKEDFQ